MARISDPDKLSKSANASTSGPDGNVHFNLTNKTIELISTTDGFAAGSGNELIDAGYNDGGVDLQAVYSFIKEQWKSDTDLIKYPFPMEAITAEQFEFINGWTLTDGGGLTTSKKYVRNAGYAERDTAGVIQKEYAGIISLGTLADASAQPKYAFANDTAPISFSYTGPVNEAIQIFANGGDDDRSQKLTLYVRSAPSGNAPATVTGYTFAQQDTTDIGVTVLATQAYRFPLVQVVDPNIVLGDTNITTDADGKFANMRIEYYNSPQSITETGTTFSVGVVIDARTTDSATILPTVSDIYNWVQYTLRQSTNINTSPGDSGSLRGDLQDPLVEFVGSTLKTLAQDRGQSPENNGVFIEGITSADFNNVEFIDNAGASQVFPFKVGVDLTFNENIGNDPNSKYALFYTTLNDTSTSPETVKTFGTGDAVLVQKDAGAGSVTGDIHFEQTTVTTSSPKPAGQIIGANSGTGSIVASTGVLTNGSGGYDADELIGKILNITSGTNQAKYFITDNTSTTITVDPQGKLFDVDDASATYTILNKNTSGTGSTPKITFTYNYAENNDSNRSPNNPADITLVAIGLESAQYATAAGQITRVNSVTLPVSNPLERNYEDPQGT